MENRKEGYMSIGQAKVSTLIQFKRMLMIHFSQGHVNIIASELNMHMIVYYSTYRGGLWAPGI